MLKAKNAIWHLDCVYWGSFTSHWYVPEQTRIAKEPSAVIAKVADI